MNLLNLGALIPCAKNNAIIIDSNLIHLSVVVIIFLTFQVLPVNSILFYMKSQAYVIHSLAHVFHSFKHMLFISFKPTPAPNHL
jgi:hypothetical protein